MITWQVVCPETGWRSSPYVDRAAAERRARSIDVEIARVNGLSAHRHHVVEVDAAVGVDTHVANEVSAQAARHMP
jgi:hypothetical protein